MNIPREQSMVTAVSPELTQLFQSQEENLTFNGFFYRREDQRSGQPLFRRGRCPNRSQWCRLTSAINRCKLPSSSHRCQRRRSSWAYLRLSNSNSRRQLDVQTLTVLGQRIHPAVSETRPARFLDSFKRRRHWSPPKYSQQQTTRSSGRQEPAVLDGFLSQCFYVAATSGKVSIIVYGNIKSFRASRSIGL